jgi:hypothetical protein
VPVETWKAKTDDNTLGPEAIALCARAAGPHVTCAILGNPGELERDSGMIPNAVPG